MTVTSSEIPEVDPLAEKSRAMRMAERFAQLRVFTWLLVHVGRHVDPVLMRLTRGRMNLTGTKAVVILHHVGGKTGKARQTPLTYFTQGKDVILVASSGGAPRDPAWLHNIRVRPEVELWVGERGGAYRAHVASAEERAVLWPKAEALYSGYGGYQQLTGGREIPVVVCSPAQGLPRNHDQ